jgi:hypothetical protein
MDIHQQHVDAKGNKVDSIPNVPCAINDHPPMSRNAVLPDVHSVPHASLARQLHSHPMKMLLAVCIIMLVLWCFWWAISLLRQELQAGEYLWFPHGSKSNWIVTIGCDFYNHVDIPARIWWNGGDPYANTKQFFAFPPLEMRLFAWVNLMKPRTAYGVWLIVMTAIIAAATWTASRWRRRLSLANIPPYVALVLVLFSTPALYAMERGQYDPLTLLFILAALPLLKPGSHWTQFLAGALLCLAPWLKAYPGLLFAGLIGLQRWRALAGFVLTGIVIAAVFLYTGEMQNFLVNNAQHIQIADRFALAFSGDITPMSHPLSIVLASIWLGTKFSWLGILTGKIMAVILLGLLLTWVTCHVYRCHARDALTYPYLLWITALATFVPPISNDYNLIFLPLAVLTVWSPRDPLLIQAPLILLLLWWQPIGLPVNGPPIFMIKLLGLGAAAVCLVKRASEQTMLNTVANPH